MRYGNSARSRGLLAVQLFGTILILVAVPFSLLQAALLLGWWAMTFGPLNQREATFFILACASFSGMNALALRQGIFAFASADVLGMPWYELFMWGFYGLHIHRMLGGPAPGKQRWVAWVLAVLFALCFASLTDPRLLLLATATILSLSLWFFHDSYDLAYLGYAAAVGAAIEYAGVWSGQWHYPSAPGSGLPAWSATMWAGVGLFLRRLVVPALTTDKPGAGEKLTAAQQPDVSMTEGCA
jgi:hypothetical protein